MVNRSIARGDALAGLALVALGIYILKEASNWVVYSAEGPGPGFFPLMYGGLILVLAAYMVMRSLRGGAANQPASEPMDIPGITSAMVSWIGLAVSVPLMMVLGFTVGFAIFAFFLVRVIFKKSYRTCAITAAAIAISLHIVFPVLLGAPLPVGMFWGF